MVTPTLVDYLEHEVALDFTHLLGAARKELFTCPVLIDGLGQQALAQLHLGRRLREVFDCELCRGVLRDLVDQLLDVPVLWVLGRTR